MGSFVLRRLLTVVAIIPVITLLVFLMRVLVPGDPVEIMFMGQSADRATIEEEHALELRTRDRERKLIRKIDEAIKRIEDGTYGYCVETGEEIGIKRLEARPVATLCVEAQERRERREKQYGDRDDRYR